MTSIGEIQTRIALKADRIARTAAATATRRKCFVSYHASDAAAVEQFIDDLDDVFIPRVLGVSDYDDFIDSKDSDYIMRRIREKYLTDSSVTIVLIGKCTWARKFIDWEIASTLRNDPNNKRSGLLGINLDKSVIAPPRFADNWRLKEGQDPSEYFARRYSYPKSTTDLRDHIDAAFAGRQERANRINNKRELFAYNRSCP